MSTGLVRAVNSSIIRLEALKNTISRLSEQENTDCNLWLVECLQSEIEDIEQELNTYYQETNGEPNE